MADYTPTIEAVRMFYGCGVQEAEQAFDRWLAANHAEVRAEAARETEAVQRSADYWQSRADSAREAGRREGLADGWGACADHAMDTTEARAAGRCEGLAALVERAQNHAITDPDSDDYTAGYHDGMQYVIGEATSMLDREGGDDE